MIDLGDPDGPTPRRAVPGWWPLLPLGLVVLLLVVVIQGATRPLAGAPVAARTLRAVASGQGSVTSSSSGPLSGTAPPADTGAVRQLGHPLLPGMTGTWQLLARGDEWLSRVDPRTGRIDSKTIPGLDSGGPVGFLSGPDETLVRPMDFVDGYLIPDRYPTQRAAALLDHGPVFPGPDAEHIWAAQKSGSGSGVYLLLDWRGHPSGPVIAVPAGLSPQDAIADGAGGLVFVGQDGAVTAAGPKQSRRLGAGAVLATGPAGVLILECAATSCAAVLASRVGARRVIPGAGPRLSATTLYEPGQLSPDGRTAAVVGTPVRNGRPSTPSLALVDLRTGKVTTIADRVPVTTSANLAWSPDSRWLFAIVGGGEIVAVDHLGGVWGLNLDLPPQLQLVIRPVGR